MQISFESTSYDPCNQDQPQTWHGISGQEYLQNVCSMDILHSNTTAHKLKSIEL